MFVPLKRWMNYVPSLGTKHLVPILTQELRLTAPRMAMATPCGHKTAP